MPRPKGSTNRTPREKEAEARHLQKEAKLQRRIEAQKKTIEDLRKKSR